MGIKKTENGRREDLEKLKVNEPEGFIGSIVYPVINRSKKNGTLYYGTLTADSAAQTGRTLGDAPTATNLAASNTTFTCTEIIKRYGVPYSTVDELGGIAGADRKGAMGSKRSVMRKIEDDIAIATLKGTHTAHDVGTDPLDAILAGIQSVKRYAGKTTAVMSDACFRALLKDDAIQTRINRFNAVVPADNSQVLALKKTILEMVIECDILIGDDDQWAQTTGGTDLSARAAIMKIPTDVENIMEIDPIYGCAVQYAPDGKSEFQIDTFASDNYKNNFYDATTWRVLKTLNAGALYLLEGIDSTI